MKQPLPGKSSHPNRGFFLAYIFLVFFLCGEIPGQNFQAFTGCPPDTEEDFSLVSSCRSRCGGTTLLVEQILVIMSLYSIAIMVERGLVFAAIQKETRRYVPQIREALIENRMEDALLLSERYPKSHIAGVVKAGLGIFKEHDLPYQTRNDIIEAVKLQVHRASVNKLAELKQGLSGLMVIASTAPFIGLLATTIELMNCLHGMKQSEGSGIGAIASGVAEALTGIGFGIFVAVFSVWMFTYFTSKVESFALEMESSSLELVNYFQKRW